MNLLKSLTPLSFFNQLPFKIMYFSMIYYDYQNSFIFNPLSVFRVKWLTFLMLILVILKSRLKGSCVETEIYEVDKCDFWLRHINLACTVSCSL